MYSLFVKNISNGDIYELPYSALSFTEELNSGKDAQINLDYKVVDEIAKAYNTDLHFLLSGGQRELWIEKNGTKIYFGVISDLGLNKDQDGGLSVVVASVGLTALLGKRRTGAKRIFSNTDAGTIALTLINESQSSDTPYSDLGISQGLIQSSVSRDRTFRFANIKDEIIQMSNVNLKNGFDFDIDNTKKFNIYYPQKGSNRDNIFFDEHNIISWDYRKPLILSLANKVYVLGEGFNDDVIYTTRISDTSYRSVFGTLEDVLAERDVKVLQTLQDKGDRYLLDNQAPTVQLTINHLDDDPDIVNYDPGDSFRIRIDEIGVINTYMRVIKRTVSIDSNQMAVVQLTLK